MACQGSQPRLFLKTVRERLQTRVDIRGLLGEGAILREQLPRGLNQQIE
jgi:hypothetical protein